MTFWREDPEHLRMEAKYQETGDIRFAALAVGRWHAYGGRPESAPAWALEACTALYERAIVEIATVVAKTQGSGPMTSDHDCVRWVADQQFAGSDRTPRQLIRKWLQTAGSPDVEGALRRILGYYTGQTGPGAKHHVEHAAKRIARVRGVREVGDI